VRWWRRQACVCVPWGGRRCGASGQRRGAHGDVGSSGGGRPSPPGARLLRRHRLGRCGSAGLELRGGEERRGASEAVSRGGTVAAATGDHRAAQRAPKHSWPTTAAARSATSWASTSCVLRRLRGQRGRRPGVPPAHSAAAGRARRRRRRLARGACGTRPVRGGSLLLLWRSSATGGRPGQAAARGAGADDDFLLCSLRQLARGTRGRALVVPALRQPKSQERVRFAAP